MSSLDDFIGFFPEVRLPVTLTDAMASVFSQTNPPAPQELIAQFILPYEEEAADELTEFVPCFRIPETHDFHALVYWRASLMRYQFVLLCLDKTGRLIDRKVLSGTFSRENTLIQSVATIDEDWEILVVSGQAAEGTLYQASSSSSFRLELLPEGQIVHLT